MKINWEITLLSLIALFLGIVVYTIWSVYNFGPVKAGIAQAVSEYEVAQEKRAQEAREKQKGYGAQGLEMFGGGSETEERYHKGVN